MYFLTWHKLMEFTMLTVALDVFHTNSFVDVVKYVFLMHIRPQRRTE